MKVKIITLLLTLTVITTQAQDGFFLGLSGHGGASFIINQNSYGFIRQPDYKLTAGYGGNFRLGYMITKVSGLQAEIGIQSGGQYYDDDFRFTGGTNSINFKKQIKMTYLTSSIAYRMSFAKKKHFSRQMQKARFSLVAGFEGGLLTSASHKVLINNQEYTNFPSVNDNIIEIILNQALNISNYDSYERPENDKDFFQKVFLGVTIQPGLDYYFNKNLFINVSLRNSLLLTDINADEYRKHDGYGASRKYNIGLQFGLGYTF